MTHRFARFFVIGILFLFPMVASGATSPAHNELAFLDGLSLVVLDTNDIPSLHLARRMVQSYGGTVAVMSPPSLLIGWVPFEAREALIGKAGIRDIYYTEVFPGEVNTSDPRSDAMVRFFNAAVRGDLAREFEEAAPSAAEKPAMPHEALAHDGILPGLSSPETTGNSDYMTGTVALTLFFVESNGSGSDPDLYTWTPESMQHYLNGVTTALAWWSNQAQTHGDCWVTFLINYYSGADPRCQQWTEPILHDTSYEDIWVNEIMSNFGYTSGNRWTRVTAFNTWQRSYYQTNRSYSAFIPYNPPPAATTFPGGATAYAYWYGPYTVLLFRVQGWIPAQVFAHESGHIFGACDEYSGGCGAWDCTSVCANGTVNGNCEECNPDSRDCMMKANTFSLCGYTARQVGWEVTTPCAPPEPPLLPSPTLATVDPPYGGHGTDFMLAITGTNFYPGLRLDMGSDVFVHTITLVGQTRIDAHVEILDSAPPGLRDVRLINRDGQYTTLPGAFEVRLTTRHYYSPGGGNNAPYITPAGAATSLDDAIAATYDGDTLFVVSGTFDDFSIVIDRGVLLYGGWNNTFTARNIETGKTILNLSSNVTFLGAGAAAGLDGFLLQNGTGASDVSPFPGRFGGAIRFVGGTGIVAHCEIRSSSSGDAMNYGVGGAVFANGCAVDIRDNYIHDNSATQGGALYLLDCTGSIANNTISNNIVHDFVQPAIGAGLVVKNASDLTLTNNVVTGNTQASEGGGVYFEASQGITMSGGAISGNEASFSGGGIIFKGSTGVIDGVRLLNNFSATIGGGLSSVDASDLTVTGTSFVLNRGMIGGGVYAASGHFSLRHSLFAHNNATVTSGAMIVTGVESGELAGNTVDSNSSPAVGGMFIGFPGGQVYDNIVTNNTGTGIACSGNLPALLAYNLVWGNSGGDYSGCAPGEGSLSVDPLYIDPGSEDYHLGLHSPAIDSGRPGPSYQDPDGSRGDMGIYGSHAFVMDQPSYPKNLRATREGVRPVLWWNLNPESDVAHYAVYGGLTEDFVPTLANFITLVAGTDSTVSLDPPADSLYYRISAVDNDGYAGGYSKAVLYSPTATAVRSPTTYPFALHQNVPNPFNPSTKMSYELPTKTDVKLTIYDVDGRLVQRLVDGVQGPGLFSVTWGGRNQVGEPVASGVYFYQLQAGACVQTKKMVFVK
jgi:hypothetical protein